MIELCTAGGMSGADLGGLRAALATGLQTSGFAPRGWWTEHYDPATGRFRYIRDRALLESFGLVECPEPEDDRDMAECFRRRTRANVEAADLTVWFGYRFSGGGRTTERACRGARKPFLHPAAEGGIPRHKPAVLAEMLTSRGVRILNVAGNRESRAPGIGLWVESYLIELFSILTMNPGSQGR